MASPLTEDHICFNIESGSLSRVPLNSDEAGLLRMLQIVSMAFSYLAVNCLLDPCNLINEFIPILFHHLKSKSIFSVNDPDE